MSSTSKSVPSLSLMGLLHIMMPLVREFFVLSKDWAPSSRIGNVLYSAAEAPTSRLAKLDLPELIGPTMVTIESF